MQRKFFFVIALIILAFCASVSRSSAQVKGSLWPDRFNTADECMSALATGHVRYYQPSFFKPKKLVDGEKVIPLEAPACVHMRIVGRTAWVPQAAGSEFVFRGPTINRRKDCGNRADQIAYLEAPYRQEAFVAPAPPTTHAEWYPPTRHDFFIPEERHHGVPWVKAGTTALGLGLLGYGVYALWPRSHHTEVNININKSLSALMSVIQ